MKAGNGQAGGGRGLVLTACPLQELSVSKSQPQLSTWVSESLEWILTKILELALTVRELNLAED